LIMVMEKVSVIIPCFNAEGTIKEALLSVANQTHQNLEIIVVDDGSSDATVEKAFEVKDNRIRILSQGNQRAGAARNHGYFNSCGDWILFLDADDLICKDHIKSLLESATTDRGLGGVIVAASAWRRFYPDGSIEPYLERATYKTLSGIDWLLLDWANCYMTQCGMFLLPKRLIENSGSWRSELSFGPNDDFEFFCRMLVNVDVVTFSKDACLFYRSGQPGSLSKLNDEAAIAWKLKSLELGSAEVLRAENSGRVRLAVANLFQRFVYEHYPLFPKLLGRAEQRVKNLGGSSLPAMGPPRFQLLKRAVGWRLAKITQMLYDNIRSRCKKFRSGYFKGKAESQGQ
jgi:glycosyltransferase involved in cell wall biosynthesis